MAASQFDARASATRPIVDFFQHHRVRELAYRPGGIEALDGDITRHVAYFSRREYYHDAMVT